MQKCFLNILMFQHRIFHVALVVPIHVVHCNPAIVFLVHTHGSVCPHKSILPIRLSEDPAMPSFVHGMCFEYEKQIKWNLLPPGVGEIYLLANRSVV